MIRTLIFSCLAACILLCDPYQTLSQNLALSTASEKTTEKELFSRLDSQALDKLLEEARGKIVFMNFFASWCPPCRREIPILMRMRKRYLEEEILIIGLSVDTETKDLKKFLQRMPLNYPIFMVDEKIAINYGVDSIPHNTVYDKTGKLIGNQPGLITEDDLRPTLDMLVRK